MADQKKIVQHAKEETQEYRECPICGHKEWKVSDTVYMLSAPGDGENGVEVACVKCGNCGFIALFAEE